MKKLDLNNISVIDIQKEEISLKDIAIVGISLNMPGANSLRELWGILEGGSEAAGSMYEPRWNDTIQYMQYMNGSKKNLYKCGYLDEIDKFDYKFFRLSYREACSMDPKHRLFLQSAWKAVEDAGYNTQSIRGTKTGVYIGVSDLGDYKYVDMVKNVVPETVISAVTGNTISLLPSRFSYLFDLRGPSMVIDTACSSSMTALIQACQAIRNRNIDMAVVSGIRIYPYPIDSGIKLGMESSDGKTRTFDYKADGTGMSEAVISVFLKPFDNAVKDNNYIYGIIKGYALNQDGDSIGLTAPNGDAQIRLLEEAWRDSGINPEDLTYIETHGTATKLGDPIEVAALTKAFSKYTEKKQFCGIGSIKSNMGHSYDASGLVSLMKVLSILKNKCIPRTINYNILNPEIDIDNSAIYITDINRKLKRKVDQIICGISSFGFSGTNAHIIVQGYYNEDSETDGETNILAISAKTKTSLKEQLRKLYSYVWATRHLSINDLCYTYAHRDVFEYRIAFAITNKIELKDKLKKIICGFDNIANFVDVYISSNLAGTISIKNRSENTICQRFIDGDLQLLWSFYSSKNYKLKPVPTYSFDKRRCWIQIPEGKVKTQMIEQGNTLEKKEKQHVIVNRSEKYIGTNLDQIIADAWGHSLGCLTIDVNDNYFSLGGDSILAIQICNDLNKVFKTQLTVADIMKYPTFCDYSKYVAEIVNSNFGDEKSKLMQNTVQIPKCNRMELNITSSAQKRMYITQEMNPLSIYNNITRVWVVRGEFSVDRFIDSVRTLMERHEILRTTYCFRNGDLYQKIAKKIEPPVSYIEKSSFEFDDLIKHYIKPFDLKNGPLFRIVIVKYIDCYKVLFDFHHIITDGTSNGIIADELMKIYEGQQLAAQNLQYVDYANWQFKEKGKLKKQKEYWLNEFKTKPEELFLDKLDYEIAPAGQYTVMLSEYQTNILNRFSSRQGISVFSVLLSILFANFRAYSGKKDFVIGIPTTGRNNVELAEMVGVFINTLPIRISITEDDTLLDLINKVFIKLTEAFNNQDYQFDDLISDLREKDHQSPPNLFSIMFMYHNMLIPKLEVKDLNIEDYSVFCGESQYPFVLEASPLNNQIELKFTYQKNKFDESFIENMAANYIRAVEKIESISAELVDSIEYFEKQKRKIEYKEKLEDFVL